MIALARTANGQQPTPTDSRVTVSPQAPNRSNIAQMEFKTLLHSDRTFDAPAAQRAAATIQDFRLENRRSLENPDGFWGAEAARHHWFEPWTKVLEHNFPDHAWFVGGKTNITFNCLDRHAHGAKRDQDAMVWYGEDAMGGAVNFITAKPKFTEVHFGSEVGNFGVNAQNLDASFSQAKVNEELSLWRDFSSGFRPDREYRNSEAFLRTGFTTSLGSTTVLLGISDKPFGADQYYCVGCNSFERTKAWFTGLRQGIGKNTEFDFGYRRHTDEFILLRDNPSYYENNHIDESYQFALRRHQDRASILLGASQVRFLPIRQSIFGHAGVLMGVPAVPCWSYRKRTGLCPARRNILQNIFRYAS